MMMLAIGHGHGRRSGSIVEIDLLSDDTRFLDAVSLAAAVQGVLHPHFVEGLEEIRVGAAEHGWRRRRRRGLRPRRLLAVGHGRRGDGGSGGGVDSVQGDDGGVEIEAGVGAGAAGHAVSSSAEEIGVDGRISGARQKIRRKKVHAANETACRESRRCLKVIVCLSVSLSLFLYLSFCACVCVCVCVCVCACMCVCKFVCV